MCDPMSIAMDTKSRRYEMSTRADSTRASNLAIVEAAQAAIVARRSLDITLGMVAERSGLTVKTILRHFGNREALIDAAWSRMRQDVLAEREAPPGDPGQALAVLIEHYERRGDVVLGLLGEEDGDRRARLICDEGRHFHRDWVAQAFAGYLPSEGGARDRLIDALVVVTDVYSWKLLRRDRGLTVDDTHRCMQFMTDALLSAGTGSQGGAAQ